MRLVDTSAWIEWLIDSKAGRAVEAELPTRHEWLVPTIVQLELTKWLAREADQNKADQAIAFSRTCVVMGLDTRLALAAADMCANHKLATADAIIYATALVRGADLLTCDAHFEGLPHVTFIAKDDDKTS